MTRSVIVRFAIALVLVSGVGLGFASSAGALRKIIWGPTDVNGKSQFPIYHDLDATIYQTGLNWATIAPTRPKHPRNPADPAYDWPKYAGYAIRRARKYGIRIAFTLTRTPGWANGGRPPERSPNHASDFADFAMAAARRYRYVHLWMIWGEPSRRSGFRPMPPDSPVGPRRYAEILDASYGALKRVSSHNLVIGGNTFTAGEVHPLPFVRWMTLKNGRRPRMDLYGHNPFSGRRPRLSNPPTGHGYVDFSDLDQLAHTIDRYWPGQRIKLFLSEFTVPTKPAGRSINIARSEKTSASWLSSAFRIARRWHRIYALGWYTLYDEAPLPHGGEELWGLITSDGRRKPSYYVFRRGR